MTTTAYCPGCRAQLSNDQLSCPVTGCGKCGRVIHFPDFRAPEPKEFDRLERASRQLLVRLLRAWRRGDTTKRAQIETKLRGLISILEMA